MMWTLVQKSVASLDQRFENAQDKLLESLYGTKKVFKKTSTITLINTTLMTTVILFLYYCHTSPITKGILVLLVQIL